MGETASTGTQDSTKQDIWGSPVQPGRQRAVLVSAARTVVVSILIVALGGVLGNVAQLGAWAVPLTLASVILWLALFGLYLIRQVQVIRRSGFPEVRALEALIIGIVLFISIFATAYYLLSLTNGSSFTESLDHFTAYYYTVTVLATVGFGDVTPLTTVARSLTMIQMFLGLGIVAVAVRILTRAVRTSAAHRNPEAS